MKSTFTSFAIVSVLFLAGNATAARAGGPPPCGNATAPQCGGVCQPFEICVPVSEGATTSGPGPECVCVPDFQSFDFCGDAPQCGGECDEDFGCIPASVIFPQATGASPQGQMAEPCLCFPEIEGFCGIAPQCGGECPQGAICRPAVIDAATRGKEEGRQGAATQGVPVLPCTCQEPTSPGACCLPAGSCQQLEEFECSQAGGAFSGEGAQCTASLCGDPGEYDPGECSTPFEDISASGTVLTPVDDGGEVVPLGFSFTFYSQVHTSIGISSNGFLSFGSNLSTFIETAIPDPSSPNSLIAPLWDDLNPQSGGSVQYQTLGSAPNRRFVAQWTAVPEFANTDANTFQAVLFEGSNAIEFRYGALSLLDGSIGVENTVGLIGTAIARASIGSGDCILLAPRAAPNPAEAPALGRTGLAIGVFVLLAIALSGLWRMNSSRRG